MCVLFQMAENERLRDLLLVELSDLKLFCKLLKYPSVHENLLKIFKVSNITFVTAAMLMSSFGSLIFFCFVSFSDSNKTLSILFIRIMLIFKTRRVCLHPKMLVALRLSYTHLI